MAIVQPVLDALEQAGEHLSRLARRDASRYGPELLEEALSGASVDRAHLPKGAVWERKGNDTLSNPSTWPSEVRSRVTSHGRSYAADGSPLPETSIEEVVGTLRDAMLALSQLPATEYDWLKGVRDDLASLMRA